MYNYFANGLQIASDIQFPELQECIGNGINVVVRVGEVPLRLENIISEGPLRQIAENEFLLNIDKVARYLVRGNSEIIIHPYPGAEDRVVRLYVLSTLFGVLFHKNNLLPLHASCIKVNNEAVILAGHSGVGKSTTALGLYKKGYEILNDDISTVFFDAKGEPYVYPGYVHLKLWAESLEVYGYETGRFSKLRSELEKYSYPLERDFDIRPVKVKSVFFLSLSHKDIIQSSIPKGVMIFELLKSNTFRYGLVQGLKKNDVHFRLCAKLVNKVQFKSISRPAKTAPSLMADYIEEQILSL